MSWMAWTMPTAAFFIGIAVLLVVMTIWELRGPTTLRRGWLPLATTRGDRVFISLLLAAFLHLLALAWGLGNLVPVSAFSALLFVVLLIKG